MKYQGIIFDLDGVICHTDHHHYKAWKKIADELAIPFDEKMNHHLRGVSRRKSLEIILKNYHGVLSEEEKEALMEKKNNYYRNYLKEMSPKDLDEDVLMTIEVLKVKGYKMAIGSSSKNAKFILSQLGLLKVFDYVSDGNSITHSKPDPEVFLKACEGMKLEPNRCLVVEDAKSGIEASLAGGIDCAAIGDATTYGLATYTLRNLRDLLEIV